MLVFFLKTVYIMEPITSCCCCFFSTQAQKTQKPPQKPAPAVVSVAPAVKDPLVKKPEIKLKLETPSTFLAFKRTEVKVMQFKFFRGRIYIPLHDYIYFLKLDPSFLTGTMNESLLYCRWYHSTVILH